LNGKRAVRAVPNGLAAFKIQNQKSNHRFFMATSGLLQWRVCGYTYIAP
jgi:hypothetical protein